MVVYKENTGKNVTRNVANISVINLLSDNYKKFSLQDVTRLKFVQGILRIFLVSGNNNLFFKGREEFASLLTTLITS
jgi:hypothetical protein